MIKWPGKALPRLLMAVFYAGNDQLFATASIKIMVI